MAMTDMTPQEAIESWLKEYGGSGVSVAELLCDRHARIPEKTALFYEDAKGQATKYTFRELQDLSSKMAGFLQSIGIKEGDRVAFVGSDQAMQLKSYCLSVIKAGFQAL